MTCCGGVQPKAPGGAADSLNRSGLFNNINPGKYGITLNMSLPQGRDLFKRLIARSSVLCENYSPGQMDRWEPGYEVLRDRAARRYGQNAGLAASDQRRPVCEGLSVLGEP